MMLFSVDSLDSFILEIAFTTRTADNAATMTVQH